MEQRLNKGLQDIKMYLSQGYVQYWRRNVKAFAKRFLPGIHLLRSLILIAMNELSGFGDLTQSRAGQDSSSSFVYIV